jgi:hypothetical protein
MVRSSFWDLDQSLREEMMWSAASSALRRESSRSKVLRRCGPNYLRAALTYLVPIPAFFYFDAAGFFARFGGRKTVIAIAVPFLCLFVATLPVRLQAGI